MSTPTLEQREAWAYGSLAYREARSAGTEVVETNTDGRRFRLDRVNPHQYRMVEELPQVTGDLKPAEMPITTTPRATPRVLRPTEVSYGD